MDAHYKKIPGRENTKERHEHYKRSDRRAVKQELAKIAKESK